MSEAPIWKVDAKDKSLWTIKGYLKLIPMVGKIFLCFFEEKSYSNTEIEKAHTVIVMDEVRQFWRVER